MSLHLYLITTGSCLLIGLSSMISLFLFSRLFLSASPRKSQAPSRNGSVVTNNTKFDTFDPNKSEGLKRVLSFAVGCLLGDVFLHLLPEASTQLERNGYSYFERLQYLTTWIALGGIFFCALESLSMLHDGNDEPTEKTKNSKPKSSNPMTGYLNLLANAFDNFIHGIAVGASFLAGYKMGVLTTMAIMVHEIPHEIADYIILVRSGFTSWRAFLAQLSLTLATVLGALAVLCFEGAEGFTLWILPFTSGGFLYIALAGLLPELREVPEVSAKSPGNKLIFSTRFVCAALGILIMSAVNKLDY